MQINVRPLRPSDWDAAAALVWRTFQRCEAPQYGPQGVARFRRDVLDNPAFRADFERGDVYGFGAWADARALDAAAPAAQMLAGVWLLRNATHLTLAFTDERCFRRGVGRALFTAAVAEARRRSPQAPFLTVNASPYGLGFYKRLGFFAVQSEQCVEGVRFTPMKYRL